MKLEEKHKEFAVKCFARFMTRTQVLKAFIEEFEEEVFQPPNSSHFPDIQADIEREFKGESVKKTYIAEHLEEREAEYQEMYGISQGQSKYAAAKDELYREAEQAYAEYFRDIYSYEYEEAIKRNMSNRLRRLNITHRQFPEKYRTLFNQAREEFFANYRNESLQNPENVTLELETLYGYVKQRIFQEKDPQEAMKHLNLAHQILKTIATYNAINAKQGVVDITPPSPKALQNIQKALTDQLKKETRQPEKPTENGNA